jgi:hypothetical protein
MALLLLAGGGPNAPCHPLLLSSEGDRTGPFAALYTAPPELATGLTRPVACAVVAAAQ